MRSCLFVHEGGEPDSFWFPAFSLSFWPLCEGITKRFLYFYFFFVGGFFLVGLEIFRFFFAQKKISAGIYGPYEA